jgi:hypothetical protein
MENCILLLCNSYCITVWNSGLPISENKNFKNELHKHRKTNF